MLPENKKRQRRIKKSKKRFTRFPLLFPVKKSLSVKTVSPLKKVYSTSAHCLSDFRDVSEHSLPGFRHGCQLMASPFCMGGRSVFERGCNGARHGMECCSCRVVCSSLYVDCCSIHVGCCRRRVGCCSFCACFAGAVWADSSSAHDTQALCGLLLVLCGMLQPVCMLHRRHVGFFIICVICY